MTLRKMRSDRSNFPYYTSLRLPSDMARRVEAMAREEMTSPSGVIRRLTYERLQQLDEQAGDSTKQESVAV